MAVRIEQKIKRARRASALSQINGGGRRHARRHSLGSAEDANAEDTNAGAALTSTMVATSQHSGTRRVSLLDLAQTSRSAKALEDTLPRTRTVPITQVLEVGAAACAGNTQHISYTNFAAEAVQSTRFARRHGNDKEQGRALPVLVAEKREVMFFDKISYYF